jgi:hypothetical protein
VDLVQRDNEVAFVPKLAGLAHPTTTDDGYDTNMWTYELGKGEEARAFWGTERVDYGIWVDFSSSSLQFMLDNISLFCESVSSNFMYNNLFKE